MFSTSTRSESIRSIFCFLFLTQLSFALHAQVVQSGRIDIPINNNIETYSVVSLDTAGVVLYRSFIGPNENQVELIRMDTSLRVLWKGFLPVPKGLSVVSAKTVANKIFFFFEGQTTSKRIFNVFVVQAKNGGYTSYPIKNIIAFNPTDFVASKDALLIGGYFNFRPIVLFYSLKDHRSRILPGFLNEPGEITQINASENGNIDVIVSAKNSSRKKCLWIRHFDESGDLIKTIVLEPEEGKNLIFGRAAKMDNDNQVIAGVYGKNAQYSRGIFVAEVNSYGEYIIRYYNFADLQNFFHYMKANREKRVKERIERRRVKGKKIKFNYRFLVHELIPYGNQFVMLGEAFYPTYSNRYNSYNSAVPIFSSPWSYGLANRYYYNGNASNLIFDGFQYTHAVVIGFNTQAKLIWDNSFEINGLKSFQLEQFVKILPEKDKIALIYLYQNLIRSKVISNDQVVEGTVQDPIMTADNEKSLKNKVQSSKLEYWYPHHLFVYGVQDIKGNNDITHKVFFISKLSAP